MECIMDRQNVNIFARAIQAYARIGSELYLEANADGLSIRATNATKSAFASLIFKPDFFIKFKLSDSNDGMGNMCKLSLKSFLNVFGYIKQAETFKMTLDVETFTFIVQSKCRLDMVRTHNISVMELESLQAFNVKDTALNVIKASHKIFSEIVNNCKSNEMELTFAVNKKQLVAQNYLEGSTVDERFVRSKFTLERGEFDHYQITADTSITFCLRELRALLSFFEILTINMSVQFDTPGEPIVFILEDFDLFEANLVMSTLSPDAINHYTSSSTNTTVDHGYSIATVTTVASSSIAPSQRKRGTKEATQPCKRTRPTITAPGEALRNAVTNNNDHEQYFGFDCDRESPSGMQGKRRTTASPPSRLSIVMDVDGMDDEISITPDIELPSRPSLADSHTDLPPNLTNEHIHVEFAESDSIQMNESENRTPVQVGRIRDHGALVRHVFSALFNPPVIDLGEVLVEASDEDEYSN